MSRKPREQSSSDIYHVMLCGINQQVIFEDEEDYEKFLQVLQDCITVSRFKLEHRGTIAQTGCSYRGVEGTGCLPTADCPADRLDLWNCKEPITSSLHGEPSLCVRGARRLTDFYISAKNPSTNSVIYTLSVTPAPAPIWIGDIT